MYTKEAKGGAPQGARPRVGPGGLVTVAYMKARLDEGKDQLGIFMPLVFDVMPTLESKHFGVSDVQKALSLTHGVAMPQQAITTLLRRASRQHYLLRNVGRYQLNPDKPPPKSNVTREKASLSQAQLRLGEALKTYASKRGLSLESSQSALDLILSFLQVQQVALLLGSPTANGEASTPTARQSTVVAEFLYDVVAIEPGLKAILTDILEGLVLYHAAFLPDLSDADKRFRELTVIFDSGLVRQALGYEGTGPKLLVRETIDLLQASGVLCVVFDKTVQEIHRILRMYEQRLGTQHGRRDLWAYAMARHFITQRYSPSDVQEMSALLESEIVACGLRIVETPPRLPEFTRAEAKLAERLADRRTQESYTPRVIHDVDCVAGVLTFRGNHRSARIEDARAVFVTTTQLVIANTRHWWEVDEGESGVPPVVHVRALANLAWLKRPSMSGEFQIRDLIALCAAAMRPSSKTWERFLVHLDKLQVHHRLTADQATAIMVSAVSDRLLRDAELDQDDGDDIDAGTLDEVVDRVLADYEADAQVRAAEAIRHQERTLAGAEAAAAARVTQIQAAAEAKVSEVEAKAQNIAEELRRRDLAIEARARAWANLIAGALYWAVAVLTVIGASAVAMSHPFEKGWIGVVIALAIIGFVMLELAGGLDHLHRLKGVLETRLHLLFRGWLLGHVEGPPCRRLPTINDETI
jgi:hypothetical protein